MVTFLEKNSDEFIMMRLDDYNNNNEGFEMIMSKEIAKQYQK